MFLSGFVYANNVGAVASMRVLFHISDLESFNFYKILFISTL